ncbi:hypothetical protein [Salinarimonas ramus]|uniref:Uncharacterized protein n=1 Tax=Salinarimonas ramus TaxID=690164 RepID=A0A917Q7Q2_9HYPH|nr:hypothetical protein [Salinarimonas ramus]GGK33743.1 hypothetical protein GCM10011322_20510 [Salinarimonas ramus]
MTDARARHASLVRIHALQETKRKLEEWKLADFARRTRAVAQAQEETIAALNADTPLKGLFVESGAKRLESLARQRRQLEAASERQEEAVRVEARREKAAGILKAEAARQVEDERRRKEDLDILEAFLAGGGEAQIGSLRKEAPITQASSPQASGKGGSVA